MVQTQRSACHRVLRDVEYHAVIQRIVELRFGPSVASYREVLSGMLNPKESAMLSLALSFFTWRTLVRDAASQGLRPRRSWFKLSIARDEPKTSER
jgi:hypothetical protein